MTTPTLKVEIAFDDDPLTVSPTWTDVTAYVRDSPGVQISRGRPTELDTFTPGRCTFTLDNNDGEFSPLNSSSTYNGKLLPGKQVRVTATYSSTDYRLFRGFITGWPQRYAEGKRDAIVPILAFDALSKLNELPLDDQVVDYMLSLGSLHSFHRTLSGNVWLDDLGTRHFRRSSGVVQGSGTTLAPALTSTGVSATSGQMTTTNVIGGSATAATYSFWIQTTASGTSSTSWMAILCGPLLEIAGEGLVIGIDNAGLLRYQSDWWASPLVFNTAQTVDPVNDGEPHHIVVTDDGASVVSIFVDGADATNYLTGYADSEPTAGGAAIHVGSDGQGFHTNFTGTIQDLASFDDVVMTEAQAARLYQLGMNTYSRSTESAMGDVLDAADWPAGLRSIATNTYGQAAATWEPKANALSTAQRVATTEQGRFFVSREGNITLLSRYSHQLDATAITSQHTFSDDGSDSDYSDIGFDYDDVLVRNQVSVSGVAGSGFSENTTSVTAYGGQSGSVSTFLPTVGLANDMADGLVGWWKDPHVRSLPLTCYPQTDPAQWPSVLALELGQRVTFEITPPGVGSQVATELILEQMDWNITIAVWELTVQGSPIPADAFILDSSALDGTDVLGF